MIADWCAGSYTDPANPAVRHLEGEPVSTGVCFVCRRRLRTLTSGRLRRHRPYLSAAVAAMQQSGASPPPKSRKR